MSAGTWLLLRCDDARFPFRVQILRGGIPWLTLRVQDRWPTANRNIFCLREGGEAGEQLEEVERVPIAALQQRGKRLSLVLDRPRLKRCDFLFLSRAYKGRPGESYEQIYWQTQQSLKQRRPPARLAQTNKLAYTVKIASEERYPWRFPGKTTVRGRLATGDYALMAGEHVLAAVERKTFENLLAEFGVMDGLHLKLLELAALEHHAFVVEAPYEDFLSPGKLHHYSPSFCARAIADLYARHPRLRVVFCANRKLANLWAQHFFDAVWALAGETGSLVTRPAASAIRLPFAPGGDR
jgi:hypothetical protein